MKISNRTFKCISFHPDTGVVRTLFSRPDVQSALIAAKWDFIAKHQYAPTTVAARTVDSLYSR